MRLAQFGDSGKSLVLKAPNAVMFWGRIPTIRHN